MELQVIDFDEIIIMRDGQVIATNAASGEETVTHTLED